MFTFAVLVGIYSFSIFFLGLMTVLYREVVICLNILFLIGIIIWALSYRKLKLKKSLWQTKFTLLFGSLFVLQALINLVGVFGPELAFDALWYHLTLPKLYLQSHSIYHIPGGLLYYSDMPKLAEMLYIGALAFSNETTAKLFHYIFGLLSCAVIFFLAKKHSNVRVAILSVVIFYSNLVIGWLSVTAYIDLVRTFFEVAAFYYFLEWFDKGKIRDLIKTGILIGLAISTKLLAIGSIGIFMVLLLYVIWQKRQKLGKWIKQEFILILFSLLIPLPWFIFAYVYTGNPIYPIFSPIFSSVGDKVFDINLINPIHFLSTFWIILTNASDPLSPMYLILLPLGIVFLRKCSIKMKVFFVYVVLGLFVWYIISQVEGTRLLVPYLPVYSIICAATIDYFITRKKKYGSFLPIFLLGMVFVTALIAIVYRGAANKKYLPVILRQQSKHEFLSNHLNFAFSDFYDTDNYFANHIMEEDRVLLFGFHNLYYVDFPFIHATWVKPGDKFNYIAVQREELPTKYKDWQLIYSNAKTMVKLYRPPEGKCQKLCTY